MVSKAVLSTVMTLKVNASIIKFDKPPRNAKYWFPILDDTTFENKKNECIIILFNSTISSKCDVQPISKVKLFQKCN